MPPINEFAGRLAFRMCGVGYQGAPLGQPGGALFARPRRKGFSMELREPLRARMPEFQNGHPLPTLRIFWPAPAAPPPLTFRARQRAQLHRAERLLAAADAIPAGMLARVVLERELRKRCHRFNATQAGLRGLTAMLDNLRRAGRLPRGVKVSHVERLIRIGNKASHGQPVEVQEIEDLIAGVWTFCDAC